MADIPGITLTGTAGHDSLDGTAGNDLISARLGNDTVHAGAGDDRVTLVHAFPETGGDVLDGGDGYDSLQYRWDGANGSFQAYVETSNESGGMLLHVASNEGQPAATGFEKIQVTGSDADGNALHATWQWIEGEVTPFLQMSLLTATTRDVYGFLSNEGSGVWGYGINDAGSAPGSSTFNVGAVPAPTRLSVISGSGNDTLEGSLGESTLSGRDGNDYLYGNQSADLLLGGAGRDALEGGADADTLQGGADDDYLGGGDGDDWLLGGAGNDTLDGNDGNDTLEGGAGRDYIGGGAGDDLVLHRHSDEAGGERMSGSDGNDVLQVAWDARDAGLAARVDYGGDGSMDLYLAGTEEESIFDSFETIRLLGRDADGHSISATFGVRESSSGVASTLLYDARASSQGILLHADSDGYSIISNAFATATPHHVLGLSDNADHLTLLGGSADDVIEAGGTLTSVIDGGGGNDMLFGLGGTDLITGGDGNDFLFGTAGHDTLQGNAGSDQLEGGGGKDWLSGGLGNDVLYGGYGADTLIGGRGQDMLIGGTGADRFVLALDDTTTDSRDSVSDFTPGTDVLVLLFAGRDGLTAGTLDSSRFVSGTAALDTDDRFIYDNDSATLYYDADGNGAQVARECASLFGNGATLSASDIVIG